MLTLAFAQLLYTVAYKWRDLTGGSDGIAGVPKTALVWGGPSLASPRAFYFLVAACVVLVPRRVLRPRPLAVRPRHPGHPRERAALHEPRA